MQPTGRMAGIPLILLMLACVTTAAGGGIGPAREDRGPAVSGEPAALNYLANEILVRFKDETAEGERLRVAADHNLTLIREYPRLRCHRYRLPANATVKHLAGVLRLDPRVLCAQPNFLYQASECPQDPDLVDLPDAPNQWGIFACAIPMLWASEPGGGGKVIAIVDTGVNYLHPDLAANRWTNEADPPGGGDDDLNGYPDDTNGWNFVDEPGNGHPLDDHFEGHGTHVSGIAAAVDNDLGTAGVAYDARFMAVKVLDDRGGGVSINVAAGILYAADMGADVINMSFTVAPNESDPDADCVVREAVAEAYDRGSVLVGASGNAGGSQVYAPAAFEEVISVGAATAGGGVWENSSYGDELDVVAPGHMIYSTDKNGGASIRMSGTSMAAPFVSGVCALLLNEFPGMKPWELKRFLREHARDLDGNIPGETGNRDGHGLLSFGTLRDWSNAGLPEAWSKDWHFEWMGAGVTGESSLDDAADVGVRDGDDSQPDLDGVPNSTGDDGSDDGLFPASYDHLPLLPTHLAELEPELTVDLSVCGHAGPRYSEGRGVLLRSWADWNSDGQLPDDEKVLDFTSQPSGWGADTRRETRARFTKEDHFMGNPLRFRTRLVYAPEDPNPAPADSQKFGEVEDQQVVNFIEDFDRVLHETDPPVFATLTGDWAVVPDVPHVMFPDDFPQHHPEPTWELARATNYVGCAPDVPVHSTMTLPPLGSPLNLAELTDIRLRFWASHAVCVYEGCPGHMQDCRVTVLQSDSPDGPFTETPVDSIPWDVCSFLGDGAWTGSLNYDLSFAAGKYIHVVFHHEAFKIYDFLQIDDVFIWGYDDETPLAPEWASANLSPERGVLLNWTHPIENNEAAPSEPTPALYGARLSVGGDYDGAFRLTPRDFANATSTFPVPDTPGSAGAAAVIGPTIFPTQTVWLRAEDEVGLPGAVSSREFSRNTIFVLDVVALEDSVEVAPGDSVKLPFAVHSFSAALDAVACDAADDSSWVTCARHWTHLLDPLGSAIDSVAVAVPEDAALGSVDTVSVVAVSLSNPAARDSASILVRVAGAPPCIHIADHDVGNIRFSVTDQGICGYLDRTPEGPGSGFVFPKDGGTNRLWVGSLLAGTDSTYVLNRDFEADPVKDWVTAGCLAMFDGQGLPPPTADQVGEATCTDAGHPNPRGLRVTQRSLAWASPPDDDYVLVVYEVVNGGSEPILDLWLGQFTDWDLEVGDANMNKGAVDMDRNLIYMWRVGGGDGARVGLQVLSHTPAPQLSLIHHPTYVHDQAYLSDRDRFHFLSGDDPAYVVHDTPDSADWSVIAGIGPFGLLPGETVRVGFAILAGTSTVDLQANADAAQSRWNTLFGGPTAVPPPDAALAPIRLDLGFAMPNPFTNSTALRFALPVSGLVRLAIYDVAGRRVRGLIGGVVSAGGHTATWDGRDDSGRRVASGTYHARLVAAGHARTQRVTLIR